MIEGLPLYISIGFIITTLITMVFFYYATRKSKLVLFISLGWMALHAALGWNGFYELTNTLPPRFALLLGPPTLLIVVLLLTRRGRNFLDGLDNGVLTYLSVIRIPVEFILFWLFLEEWMPEVVTFEGHNFDIIAGITAPIVGFLGYSRKKLGKGVLIFWNVICFLLLTNVVVHAILAAPSPFQVLEWEQPTVAIMHFPFVWLPCLVVPIVFLSHIANLRQLLSKKSG